MDNQHDALLVHKAQRLISIVASDIFAVTTLYKEQMDVLVKLALMKFRESSVVPAPLLFVKATGGGKSLVRDIHSVMFRGVSLTIVPLLALGADQTSKVITKTIQTSGDVLAVHLDEIHNMSDQQRLVESILALPLATRKTIMIFSSPQKIVNDKIWMGFLKKIIENGLLRLVCIDEVHLFVHYGLSFRREFAMLSSTLFRHLINDNGLGYRTKIPVLFMTATCTRRIFEQMQALTTLKFYNSLVNVHWPGPIDMMNRHIMISVAYTNQPSAQFVKKIGDTLKNDRKTCFIGYGNIKTLINSISEKYGNWLDTTGYRSDYVTVTGSLKKEQKFHYTKLFCSEKNIARIEEAEDDGDRPFNPQVMLATAGAANAGIDNKNVHGVFRFEFPPSIEDCIQEEGRAGRRVGADHLTDWYYCCISLESLLSVLRRVLTSDTHADYKATMISDLHIAMSVLVLPTHCLRSIFAHKSSNPFYSAPAPLPPPCMVACSFCLGHYIEMFPSLRRDGVTSVFLDLFLGENRIECKPSIKSILLDAIVEYPNSNRLLFGTNTDKKPAPVLVKKALLVLIASGLLGYKISSAKVDGVTTHSEIYAHLGFVLNADGTSTSKLKLNDDFYWARIKTKA